MAIDLTKLSQKGQIVIPNTVPKSLGLKEGMKFLVVGVGDAIVLRTLELNEEKVILKHLLAESRDRAEKIGFSGREIERFIREARKVS